MKAAPPSVFPQQLADLRAYDIAQAMLEGFDRHYRLFREASQDAKRRFERADWHGQQRTQALRIAFYDQRVAEAVQRLRTEFRAERLSAEVWQQVKLHYIGLLTRHLQPELAETFFNSVTTRILHRDYYNNDFIFLRPAISTEYLENDEPGALATYRVYYPTVAALHDTLRRIVDNCQLERPFENLERDVADVARAMRAQLGGAGFRPRPNFQIQVLSSLFYRNKGAYLIGKVINGYVDLPFALPILHAEPDESPDSPLVIDAALFGEDELSLLFSFARAYFMVTMDIPSAYVTFLRSLMPRKSRAELYNALGLQKQGKNIFYRDFLAHLRYSSDRFRIAPGIAGMVMLVFDLPSFPYVFKVIRDRFPPQKDTTREQVQGKYLLVKQHDRVGRMADTMEYSKVAFPRERFDDALVAELQQHCASLLEMNERQIVIQHLYIERRMVPLNIHLQEAGPEEAARAVVEYGNAIKDMVAANIFPGDMLWKNFGITRQGKVVFYDYDEIEYLTDCRFRRVPEPHDDIEALSSEVWYPVGPKDVFPETFGPFLLGRPDVRKVFLQHHADLLDPAFWQAHQARIEDGHVHDVFPYDAHKRFRNQRPAAPAAGPCSQQE